MYSSCVRAAESASFTRSGSVRPSVAWLALALAMLLANSPVAALPSGRAWAPTLPVLYPGVAGYGSPRMDTDSEGVPIMVIGTRWEMGNSGWNVFAWRDSAWAPHLMSDIPSFFLPDVAISLSLRKHIAWLSPPDPGGDSRMVAAEILSDRITAPDTAMSTTSQGSEHGAAAASRRRWIVRCQQRVPSYPINLTYHVRTAYSDTVGIWHELPEQGIDEDLCTIAPLSETSAMIVYAGQSGLAWAIVEGDQWVRSGNLDPVPWRALHPRFRVRPSGGLWLLWTDRLWVHVSRYQDGQWFRGDSLKACRHRLPSP